jgi:putative DNA methylase
MPYRKKLIEVALPLEAINAAAAREKSIRHGHPSTLHLWWSRKPLAAVRAVIFAQLVDDPSEYVDELLADPVSRRKAEKAYHARLKAWNERKTVYDKATAAGLTWRSIPEPGPKPTLGETIAGIERQRLFRIIESLVTWESTTNEAALQPAREEILRSWRRLCKENANDPRADEFYDPQKLPPFYDPFAGGGTLPLEAQRLGLESYASDLNPVAVLINKAMVEIPPKFAGTPPINPEDRKQKMLLAQEWCGAQGIAKDIRYYGQWLRDEVEDRIGHFYPKVEITAEMAEDRPDLKPYIGKKLTVIAWLWVRTVRSPNPAFSHIEVPLTTKFLLASKPGKEAYVEPVIDNNGFHFTVKIGKPKDISKVTKGTSAGKQSGFLCLMSGTPIDFSYIRNEGKAGRLGSRMMAVVANGNNERIYLSPTKELETIATSAKPLDIPITELPKKALGFRVQEYGMTSWSDLFTSRQLLALTTFSDLVQTAREKIKFDAAIAGYPDDGQPLYKGGKGATAYADAIGIYLAFAIDKSAVYWNSLCPWLSQPKNEIVGNSFSRQIISMIWDYAEANPLSDSGGNFNKQIDYITKALVYTANTAGVGIAEQADAAIQSISNKHIISTDPPYFDNIGYADLSDFFYVWLRRSLKSSFPELFTTLAVPKANELVATTIRHGSKEKAEIFFLNGMTQAMQRLADNSHPDLPVTIYYAFKQTESDGSDGAVSTGWETFLNAVIDAGFALNGTWPMRTERSGRLREIDSNALASSIVLVCRRRDVNAPVATRRELVSALHNELPTALTHLQAGNIAPVDLAQAAIGPGMAVYTRYSQVLDAQGHPLSVRQALALINQTLDEVLAEQEGDFDADTRWALAWFEQHGFGEGEYGVA